MALFGKALLIWLMILLLAIANGILRESVLLIVVVKTAAFIVSGLLLCLCIFIMTYLALPWFGRLPASHYWRIGALWLVLTLAFEFVLGAVIQGHSWAQLSEPYTFKDGNLWTLVLCVTFTSPYLAARLRFKQGSKFL
ncbi:hypothetical protein GCM10009092_29570 [Bowmanella denitrificans]|uniref:Transmembrane protein n=2 Tax=Bowmanella denitrificans TaxID=366582 RepID=A0ABP3H8E1_9ALTE